MFTSQSDKVLLGRGKIYFDRNATFGAKTGLRYLGDAEKLEITTADEKAQVYDYGKPTAPLLNEVVSRRTVTLAMTLREYTKENLALALMGFEDNYTQTSTAVTGESLTAGAVKGRSYKTVKRSISSVVVKKGATVLVLGTDYDIADATLGLIHIREGSVTVSDGDALTVDYTPAAIASPGLNRIQGATASQIIGQIVFVGDPGAGPAYDAEVWKVSISSDGVLGFITGADFGSFELKAQVLSDDANHPTEPYFRLTQRA